MKKINLVNLEMEIDRDSIDADDYGHRLVECVRSMNTNNDVINLVKIHIGDMLNINNFNHVIPNMIVKPLREMGANNCVFVPIVKGYIEDITIDYIEVKHESDNETYPEGT